MTSTSWFSRLSGYQTSTTQQNKMRFSGYTVTNMLQFGRKPQFSNTISSFPSLYLYLLTDRRRYSRHLLTAVVRGWFVNSGCAISDLVLGGDRVGRVRRDTIRRTTELSRDNYLRDAVSDVSVWVCVCGGGGGRTESVSLFGVSGVGGAKVHKSDLVTVSIKALDSPPTPLPLTAPDNQPVLLIRPWIAWHWHRILRRGAPYLSSLLNH